MTRIVPWKPSPAIAISSVALIVALAGTSYAAISLPANSVGTAQLRKGAVTQQKIATSTLKALRGTRGPTGATGPAGTTGAAGAAGPQAQPARQAQRGPRGPSGPRRVPRRGKSNRFRVPASRRSAAVGRCTCLRPGRC